MSSIPIPYQLGNLLNELENGFFAIPEIQRPFVWTSGKVRDLADSIYRGDPIGAIIVWEMPRKFIEEYGELLRPLAEGLNIKNSRYMVIDGQQRLISLLLIKNGELKLLQRGGVRTKKLELYFHPIKEEFTLERKKVKSQKSWIRVKEVIEVDDTYLLLSKHQLINNQLARTTINRLKESFKTYTVTVIKIGLQYSSEDGFLGLFERISRMFEKLNTRGVRVRLPDLIEALLTAKTRKEIGESFKLKFTDVLEQAKLLGFDIPETVGIRIYMAISTDAIRFKECRATLETMRGDEIMERLEATRITLNETINMIKDFGIDSTQYLQSKYLLVPVAYYTWIAALKPHKALSIDERKLIRKWILLASFNERYTGKLETDLREDIEDLKEKKSMDALIENLPIKDLSSEMLEGEYEEKHLALLKMLYRINEAPDWDLRIIREGRIPRKVLELSYDESERHHIFPETLLRRNGYEDELINDVANMTIISKGANNYIRYNAPKEYLSELNNHDPEIIKRHFIPEDPELWELENYVEFLKKRRELILKASKWILE